MTIKKIQAEFEERAHASILAGVRPEKWKNFGFSSVFVVVVLLFYVPGKQLWLCWDGQLIKPHFSWVALDSKSVNLYFVHILLPVTGNCPS